MTIEQFATSLGLPGLLVLAWYLLETNKGKRLEKLETAQIEIEKAKVQAMTLGFQSLATKLDEHSRTELAHHAKVGEQIARLDGKIDGILDQADRFTPVGVEPPHPPRARTNPEGVPVGVVGEYSMHKPRRGS